MAMENPRAKWRSIAIGNPSINGGCSIATFDDTEGLQFQVTFKVLDPVVSLPPGCQQLPLPLPGLAAAGAAT